VLKAGSRRSISWQPLCSATRNKIHPVVAVYFITATLLIQCWFVGRNKHQSGGGGAVPQGGRSHSAASSKKQTLYDVNKAQVSWAPHLLQDEIKLPRCNTPQKRHSTTLAAAASAAAQGQPSLLHCRLHAVTGHQSPSQYNANGQCAVFIGYMFRSRYRPSSVSKCNVQ
jgi:hypothetical protein